ASSAAPPTPDALSNNAPHGSHFRPPTKTHRINSHDNYPDAAGAKARCVQAQIREYPAFENPASKVRKTSF
ncbi:hypothetical protein JTM45_07430, partial [Pseudomonas aeruginosa]|nr:hypothetical protein [Pseudomonas aeruginosa]